jgi:hypothetical protein
MVFLGNGSFSEEGCRKNERIKEVGFGFGQTVWGAELE